MRTDLDSNFEAKMVETARSPRQWLVFKFPAAGNIRISDQALGVADGLDNEYIGLVTDWGNLEDIASGDPKDHLSGEIRKVSIVLLNDGDTPFSDYFLAEDPENVEVDLYQWFTGLTESEAARIDTFVIQDPIRFNERSARLTLDLVSLSMRYDAPVGDIVTLDDWPNAAEDAVGSPIDVVIGSPGEVPLLPVKIPARTTLRSSILKTDVLIRGNDSLTVKGFDPAGGTIQIDQEQILYSSHDGQYFTISQRGANGTEAEEHISTHEIIEHITDHTYLIGRGPVSAISDIKVDGFPNKASFSEDLSSNPARVVFSEPPFSEKFADSPTFKSLQFDEIAADNTALQAHYALDPEDGAAATLNETTSLLSIVQRDLNQDLGEIHKCFLAVEYFAGPRAFTSDSVSVELNGSALGNLPRPNTQGQVVIDAEVDIDHAHNHSISGEHSHDFVDPALNLSDPSHGHNTSGGPTPAVYNPSGVVPYDVLVYGPGIPGNWGNSKTTLGLGKTFYGLPDSWESGFIKIIYQTGLYYSIEISVNGAVLSGPNIEHTIYVGAGSGGQYTVDIRARSIASYDATITISKLELTVTSGVSVFQGGTGVNLQTLRPGENAVKSDKASDDVEALAIDNIPVAITSSEPTTQSFTKLFDITSTVNFDWASFLNMAVKLQYNGITDAENIYILNVFFDVEFRRKELVFNGTVTADVDGAIDDIDGTASGTSFALLQNPIHVTRFLLGTVAGMPASYNDSSGSQADTITALDTLGYSFDGVISGDQSVRSAVKDCGRQARTRFYWNGGLLKAALRQNVSDLSVVRALDSGDFRLKSFEAERQSVADLQNRIRLAYSKNYIAGEEGLAAFAKIETGSSNASITANGLRERQDSFLFNLVKDNDMAADLLAFYTENLASASTFYTFETYLTNFDLEKEDCVSLTSNFGKLSKAKAVIRAIDRRFGSGKNKRINSLRIMAEVLSYLRLTKSIADQVTILDAISISLGFDLNIEDIVSASDEITFSEAVSFGDSVSISDSISFLFSFIFSLADSISTSDSVVFDESIGLSDDVTVHDVISIVLGNGYGADGYGAIYGGSAVEALAEIIGDIVAVLDSITFEMDSALTDSVSVTDEIFFDLGGYGENTGGYGGDTYGT